MTRTGPALRFRATSAALAAVLFLLAGSTSAAADNDGPSLDAALFAKDSHVLGVLVGIAVEHDQAAGAVGKGPALVRELNARDPFVVDGLVESSWLEEWLRE